MKLPLIWLKDYIDTKKTPQELADAFTALGLLLDKPIQNGVLDLEHRMDRADWLSIIGCARDLAAFEGTELKLPESCLERGKEPTKDTLIRIDVDCPDLCYRFNTKVFRNVKVGPSPKWIQERLEAYGMPVINNIVDITNLVMVEFGQPLHAQDTDKFEKKEIVIKRAKKGEKVTTLEGVEITLDDDTFVLTQNGKPTVIGGIVGGAKTAVDESTCNIVLDAGNYNQASVRKSARKYKIQNETVLRSDKFLHPFLCQIAVERAAKLILEYAGGDYYENMDYYPEPKPFKQMELRLERIKIVSGMSVPEDRVREILGRLGYTIVSGSNATTDDETSSVIRLYVPYYRTDIEVEDDLVSDVLRISDYSNIPTTLIASAPPKEITPKIYDYEERLRDVMVKLGAHEHITDPILKGDGGPEQITLENTQSAEKNALRLRVYDTLLPVVEDYRKHGIKAVKLFEIGKVYKQLAGDDGKAGYKETRVLECICTDQNATPYANSMVTRKTLYGALRELGIEQVNCVRTNGVVKVKQGNTLELGELQHDSFTLYTDALLKAEAVISNRTSDSLVNTTSEDITLVLERGQEFGPLFTYIREAAPAASAVELVNEYLGTERAVTVRLTFAEQGWTQSAKTNLVDALKTQFGVVIKSRTLTHSI